MGGPAGKNFSTNENKILSNIDAGRNKPLRDARLKEIEAERATQLAAQLKSAVAKPVRTKKKIIEQKGTVSILARKTDGGSDFERQNIESFARSKDGMLHANKGGKWSYNITDAKSGMSMRSFSDRKSAIAFLNAVTNKDGKVSPTIGRYMKFMNEFKIRRPGEAITPERQAGIRASKAISKIDERITKQNKK